MGCLQFDGTDDRLEWTTVTATLGDVGDGAWTAAVLFKRAATGTGFDGLIYGESGAGGTTVECGVGIHSSNVLHADVDGYGSTGQSVNSSTERYIGVAAKAAGTAPVTYHHYTRSTTTWASPSVGGNLNDQIDITAVEIGSWQGGDPFSGWIAVAALWEGAMSTANVNTLDDNWRTSDWWSNAHGAPKFLIECNVAGASVVDLAGNASVLSVTGTSLDAGETMDSWNFNGTGAAAAVPGPRPTFNAIPFMGRS